MQITNYLKMNREQLQQEIDKTNTKIKKLKEQVQLLKRLQESAKDDAHTSSAHQEKTVNNKTQPDNFTSRPVSELKTEENYKIMNSQG